ncbi:MAG: patatin-like phospholipase family protein [Actinomycetota bacterium]
MAKLGLVLGGGGLVGMAYHAGVLKALHDRGMDLTRADILVGTSAGAIMAAYLAIGWTPQDFYDYAYGRHPDSTADPDEQRDEVARIFTPLWTSSGERVRRSIGSLFAVASSRGYWERLAHGRVPLGPLRRAFPAGMYSTDESQERLRKDLPSAWPRAGIYLCAADLYSGKRVAFGTPGSPPAPFHDAVLASIAIPGVFPSIRIGDRHYVDGGVYSATSLDLAAEAGCDAILCVAPLGYRRDVELSLREIRKLPPVLLRAGFARALRREVVAARARGIEVFVIRPYLSELGIHGTNSMRHHDRTSVVEEAMRGTKRLLDDRADEPALQAFLDAVPREAAR